MKKVLAISIMAAMLLAVGVAAMAGATNWTMSLKATDGSGSNFNPALTIGTNSAGYTDGLDTAKGEPGTISPTPTGKTLATAAALIPGATKPAVLDMKAPLVEGVAKTWSMVLYASDNGGAGLAGGLKLTITPGTVASAPVYTIGTTAIKYTFAGAIVPGGSITYNAASPMPASIAWVLSNYPTVSDYNQGSALTLTIAPDSVVVTPEPSSMVALASGLFGLVGFGIRRRK